MVEKVLLYQTYSLSRIHTDWAVLTGQSHRLPEPGFRKESLDFACQMMTRARTCVEQMVNELVKGGYRFVNLGEAHVNPDPDTWDWIRDLEGGGIHLPVSLQAWLGIVGTVDLRGTHPNWPKRAYLFDDMPPSNDVIYSDALVVQVSGESIEYLRREWEDSILEEGRDSVGPFAVGIAPDHIHKANLSGGLPYEIRTDSQSVDALVLNERHCTSFSNYIRISLAWGGFPGLEYLPEGRKMVMSSCGIMPI